MPAALHLLSHATSVNEEGFKTFCDSDAKHQYVSIVRTLEISEPG